MLSLVTAYKYSINQSLILMTHNCSINNHYYCLWELVPVANCCGRSINSLGTENSTRFFFSLSWLSYTVYPFHQLHSTAQNSPCWTSHLTIFICGHCHLSLHVGKAMGREQSDKDLNVWHFWWPWFYLDFIGLG